MIKAMKAVVFDTPGEPDVLMIAQRDKPLPESNQILVRVQATAVNRADLLQRRGKYPPPVGASDILGLEIAGDVVLCGADVTQFKKGDRVLGLVSGGGYAEYCTIDEGLTLKIPDNWTYIDAAAVIENFVTANETLFELGALVAGERVMIHAGGSGVSTAGIQMANYIGAEVWTTTSSEAKIQKALTLGATRGINYKLDDFAAIVLAETHGEGVDVVEDFIGAGYFDKNLSILKPGGRLIQVGLLRGNRVELNLRFLMDKHLIMKGFILRKRPIEEKCAIVARFAKRWMAVLEKKEIAPVIDAVFPMTMVREAHRYVESNSNFGKVVLSWE